jgi:UDP-glucose 4-epimerase
MSRWLITGGCGFIGCNIVRHLLDEGGHALRVLDNLSAGGPERLAALAPLKISAAPPAESGSGGAVELVVGDMLDPELVCHSARGRDVLVHLAASTGVGPSVEDPRRDCLANVLGTLNCLEAARRAGVRRFVFASSGAPLGAVEPPLHEDKAPRPASPYGASKLAGEGYCSAYWRSFGLETVALRFGNVYGPGSDRKSSVVAAFIRRALVGQPLEIYGDGTQTRDFIFVDDLVRAILEAAHVPGIGGEIFHIATARETTVGEIAQLVVELLAQADLPPVPVWHAAPRTGDARRSYADTTKAERLLGWRATTPLEEGVRRVLRWFQEHSADTEAPVRYERVAQASPPAPLAP